MALPEQVENAGKAADDALKAMNTDSDSQTPTTPEDANLAQSGDDAATIEGLRAELAKEQHKFNVLQGKFNKEITPIKDDVNALLKLKAELKTARKRITTAEQKAAKLVTQNADFVRQLKDVQGQLDSKNIETATPGEVDVNKLLSDEDFESLLVQGIDRPAVETLAKLLSKPPQTNKPVPAADSATAAPQSTETDNDKTVAAAFWDGLDTAVPEWSAINKLPEWATWLHEPAPLHKGKIRQDILSDAQDNWDLEIVLEMFRDFMSGDSYKPASEQATTPPDVEPVVPTTPENPLENELEPDRSTNIDVTLTPATSQAMVYGADGKTKVDIGYILDPKATVKATDITMFYKDATQTDGLRIRSPETYKQIDAAILKAGAENRVQT